MPKRSTARPCPRRSVRVCGVRGAARVAAGRFVYSIRGMRVRRAKKSSKCTGAARYGVARMPFASIVRRNSCLSRRYRRLPVNATAALCWSNFAAGGWQQRDRRIACASEVCALLARECGLQRVCLYRSRLCAACAAAHGGAPVVAPRTLRAGSYGASAMPTSFSYASARPPAAHPSQFVLNRLYVMLPLIFFLSFPFIIYYSSLILANTIILQ